MAKAKMVKVSVCKDEWYSWFVSAGSGDVEIEVSEATAKRWKKAKKAFSKSSHEIEEVVRRNRESEP